MITLSPEVNHLSLIMLESHVASRSKEGRHFSDGFFFGPTFL